MFALQASCTGPDCYLVCERPVLLLLSHSPLLVVRACSTFCCACRCAARCAARRLLRTHLIVAADRPMCACFCAVFLYLASASWVLEVVRYIPQIWLNHARRHTDGFSLGFVLLSILGSGTSCFVPRVNCNLAVRCYVSGC